MKNLFCFLVAFSPLVGAGQALHSHADAAWMHPIEQLFKGMAAGDSALVRSAFVADATLVTIGHDAQGNPRLRRTTLAAFLAAVAAPRAEPWAEPIWNISADHTQQFVQVWAEYAFYVGKRFSHCGIDTFQLVQDRQGHWKIFHLADTRRQEGCVIPEAVSSRFR